LRLGTCIGTLTRCSGQEPAGERCQLHATHSHMKKPWPANTHQPSRRASNFTTLIHPSFALCPVLSARRAPLHLSQSIRLDVVFGWLSGYQCNVLVESDTFQHHRTLNHVSFDRLHRIKPLLKRDDSQAIERKWGQEAEVEMKTQRNKYVRTMHPALLRDKRN
jgi:hypothetical protein